MRWATRLWLLALGAGLALSFPVDPLEAQGDWPLSKNDIYWDESTVSAPVPSATVQSWRTYIRDNWQPSARSYCTSDHRRLVLDALDTDTYHFAVARWVRDGNRRFLPTGEYFKGHNVIVAQRFKNNLPVLIGTVAHEGTHHKWAKSQGDTVGGYDDNTSMIPDSIVNCIQGAAEEDDDDGGGGGSNENDPPDDDPTCITETVWEYVWVSCSGDDPPPTLLHVCLAKRVLRMREVKTCY